MYLFKECGLVPGETIRAPEARRDARLFLFITLISTPVANRLFHASHKRVAAGHYACPRSATPSPD